MGKILIASLFTLLIATTGGQAQAVNENQNLPLRRTEILERFKEKSLDRQERLATKAADIRKRVIGNIKRVFTQILTRYSAALERLDKIAAKIQDRINKLNGKGVNISSAQTALNNCSGEKSQAQNAIQNSKDKVSQIDSNSQNIRLTVQTSQSALHDAKAALRAYHKCLVDVTKMLKVARGKEGTESAE